MSRVEDYHYQVIDEDGLIHGYFKTKGLAHQYLLEEYPSYKRYTRRDGSIRETLINPMMPVGMEIRKKHVGGKVNE